VAAYVQHEAAADCTYPPAQRSDRRESSGHGIGSVTPVKGGSAADRNGSGACSWRANDEDRYRAGERSSTGVAESTVNQVISERCCKKPQVAWMPRGAHLRLQIRTRVLNGDWEATVREWSPGFRVGPQPVAA
jgi:hypothetical protein